MMDILSLEEECLFMDELFLEESVSDKIANFIASGTELVDTGDKISVTIKGKKKNIPILVYKGHSKILRAIDIKMAGINPQKRADTEFQKFIDSKENLIPNGAKILGIVIGGQCNLYWEYKGKVDYMAVSYLRQDYGLSK